MLRIEIRKAVETEAIKILEILRSVAVWLDSEGPGKLWSAASFDLFEITQKIRAAEVVVLKADGEIAACMYVEQSDDAFWPEANPREALYLHKLAVARSFGGLGLSRIMLDWAAQYAKCAGHQFLRLDCTPRPKLVQIYIDAGFSRVGEDIVIAGFLVARLQRTLGRSASMRSTSPIL
ncbi:GNAT family N-acetyltransferase [Rhizobium ruizarguesonis]|uniref:GNAT family N-acetyltransferase n=1 Tax=Rhizobium ruizarguesonis TaxID=2081791 RepID=UPI001030B189|nr:GNAT family N-acetyltransferase [Rhizobium ruizarguesonis]TBD43420.1 GNAT family N-acetyltransferase [Rhizobium ruizarguesonis]